MGNKSGKVCIDGNTYSYEVEDVDEFLVIHAVEKVEGGAGDNSSSKDDGPTETDRLEESMDSGYVDVSAIQSRECSPEPAAQDEQVTSCSLLLLLCVVLSWFINGDALLSDRRTATQGARRRRHTQSCKMRS